jgi:hypothetical protein
MTIRSFANIDSFDFERQIKDKIKKEIEKQSKEYILGIDEDEYIKYLIGEYTLEPLNIDYDSENISKPSIRKEWIEDRFNRTYQTEVYTFTVSYSFIGSAVLFGVRPSTWVMTSEHIYVDEINKIVSFSFSLYEQDPQEFNRKKLDYKNRAFANLDNINNFVIQWTRGLFIVVSTLFKQQKEKYKKENDFFAAINIKVNDDTKSLFTVPTIIKKNIPQPNISKHKEFHQEPTMSKIMYDDILKVIYDAGKSMEKKPSLYQNKDEESLRDQFLLFLETRYDATTATGETFNRNGKTDIMLKYAADGSNVFVAECKFWHGASEFHKAIFQLLGYLTWRDSKTSLILFVKNNDFTNVIKTIKEETKKDDYYIKENANRGESSFSYLFCLPQDKDKQIQLEIIAFHFDK